MKEPRGRCKVTYLELEIAANDFPISPQDKYFSTHHFVAIVHITGRVKG